jgi:hypothetical protein
MSMKNYEVYVRAELRELCAAIGFYTTTKTTKPVMIEALLKHDAEQAVEEENKKAAESPKTLEESLAEFQKTAETEATKPEGYKSTLTRKQRKARKKLNKRARRSRRINRRK